MFWHFTTFVYVCSLLFLGWMRTTILSLTGWTSRTPSSLTLQRSTACLPVCSSFPTAHLALKSTVIPQSGRPRRTAGYVAQYDHHHKPVPGGKKKAGLIWNVFSHTVSDKQQWLRKKEKNESQQYCGHTWRITYSIPFVLKGVSESNMFVLQAEQNRFPKHFFFARKWTQRV